MNLPNKLTILRVLLIPVFLILLLPVGPDGLLLPVPVETARILAAIVFVLSALTDYLDGAIARKRKLVSTFGEFMDPIADKLLVLSALLALVQLGEVSAWAVVIIIAREFLVQGIRLLAVNGDSTVIAAGFLGKAKTFAQMVAIVLLLLRNYPFSYFTAIPVGQILLWIAVALTLISGYDYLKANWGRIQN